MGKNSATKTELTHTAAPTLPLRAQRKRGGHVMGCTHARALWSMLLTKTLRQNFFFQLFIQTSPFLLRLFFLYLGTTNRALVSLRTRDK